MYKIIPTIVGPTASGKSDLSIRLALATRGEIINLDSIQVYRRLQIATAKVPVEERQGVPHHLIDVAEPEENFTAGDWAALAAETITDIESRGRMALVVGGTGFYLRALVQPLFTGPKTDLRLRQRLTVIRDRRGSEHLHRLLARLDPASSRRISPRNWSRVMRAIEVYFQTGNPISALQPHSPDPPELARRVRVLALNPPREALYKRINERAETMFERGLVEEVQGLIDEGVASDAKAFQAHGYRRVVEHLEGKRSREDALNQMKLDTRHYAKRQLTWWRSWPGVEWVNRFGDEAEALAEAMSILGLKR